MNLYLLTKPNGKVNSNKAAAQRATKSSTWANGNTAQDSQIPIAGRKKDKK